jgi:hypothetical protein
MISVINQNYLGTTNLYNGNFTATGNASALDVSFFVFSGSGAETGGEEAEYLIPYSFSQSKWSQFGHSGGNSLV